MDRLKIIHIVYSGLGGTADYVLNLIRGDKEHTFDQQIIFYGIEAVSEELMQRAKEVASQVNVILKSPGIDKAALNKLENHLKTEAPQAVTLHVNSLIYHIPKLLSKETRLIFVEHQANHLKTKKEWLWSILAQRKADHIVCLTENYQDQLKKHLTLVYRPKKNHVIQTGIVIADYQKKCEENQTVKFGMVSRINALKDHETLLSAFRELAPNNAELHIAGTGDLLDAFKKNYRAKNIVFHGYIPQTKIPDFMRNLSVYVQASLGETSSIAIMQAQATGLPIIGSDVTGLNTVLDSEFAIRVPVKDKMAMREALSQMLASQDLRKKMGLAAKQYALDHLDHHKMFLSYKNLY